MATSRVQNRISGNWLVLAATIGGLATCLWSALLPIDADSRYLEATRLTARWSALWFIITFAARPLSQIFGGVMKHLLRHRRHLGLGFAAAHTVHGVCIILLFTQTPAEADMAVVIGGSFVYAVMCVLAITSNNAAQRALKKNWKRLHWLGVWLLWATFMNSYANRILDPNTETLGQIMTGLLVAAAALRLPVVRRLKRIWSTLNVS